MVASALNDPPNAARFLICGWGHYAVSFKTQT